MDHPLVAKVAWASAILAVASLAIGLWSASGRLSPNSRARLGTLIVAFWVLAPPIWFWWEWEFIRRGQPKEVLKFVEHTHDLSRNLWLALVAVLIGLFGIRWPSREPAA